MKRSIKLKIYAWCAAGVFGAVLCGYFLITQSVFPVWFSLGCFFCGGYALLKAHYFNMDSELFLGLLLWGVAGVGIGAFKGIIPPTLVAFSYVLAVVLAALGVAGFYKKRYLLWISFILILEDFVILLYSNSILGLGEAIGTSAGVLLALMGGRYVFNRKRRIQKKRS